MPGAPNRPPDPAPSPPVTPALSEPPNKKALRRLAPARVALLLDGWKGTPSPDLTVPFDRAEAAFEAGDYTAALQALDLLSIRFHEPRWPSLPVPFRSLRVAIPQPQPPSWNPEHAMTPAERDALRAGRDADDQVALARASVAWAAAHGVEVGDWAARVEEAGEILHREGLVPGVYERLDPVWEGVRAKVPRPKSAGGRPTPPPAAAAAPEEA
jgi:hypothetical protein